MRWIVTIVAALMGLAAAFATGSNGGSGADVAQGPGGDFVPGCVRRLARHSGWEARAPAICGCMEREFAARDLALTDAFGSARQEMRAITQSCAMATG